MHLVKDTETWTRHRLRDNNNVRLFVRRATVLPLPLVPPELVEYVWFTAIEDNEGFAINTTAFVDYVTE